MLALYPEAPEHSRLLVLADLWDIRPVPGGRVADGVVADRVGILLRAGVAVVVVVVALPSPETQMSHGSTQALALAGLHKIWQQ